MKSRERLLTALHGGKPDRLPATIHQWQPYHLKTCMGGMSDMEAFRATGLDMAIQYLDPVGMFCTSDPGDIARESTREWRHTIRVTDPDPENYVVAHRIETPGGELTYTTGANPKTTWVMEHMVKRDEDILLIEKYMPVPKLDVAATVLLRDEIGDDGILRGYVWGDQGGAWQHAACLVDPQELIIATFIKPDWVHELLGILIRKKLRFIETMAGAGFDLVETGGGAASSTLISPDIHREFCTPYDKQMHDALHSLGFMTTYHTCGGTLGIEEMIVANGTDVSETMAPVAIGGNQEPWEYKRKIGGRLALIGGVDQFNVLTFGDEKTIRESVHTLFERVGRDGGYICAASDHFFDAPAENLKLFARAAAECVY